MKIDIRILDPRITAPAYATAGAAGLDLRILSDGPVTIEPGKQRSICTGIAIHIKDKRLCGLILPRSGLGAKGLILGNTVGLIDSDYQGQIMLMLWNRGTEDITMNPLDRVAQLIITPVLQVEFNIIDTFTPTARANHGFGSTGR